MYFNVCVAAAVGGAKVNLLVSFTHPPSVAQVLARGTEAFTRLFQERGQATTFAINCAMVFDDYLSRWVPLERSSQLQHNCQVYLFQPDVLDIAGPIPEPVPADALLSHYVSPQRSYIGSGDESPRAVMPVSYSTSSAPSFVPRDIPEYTSYRPSISLSTGLSPEQRAYWNSRARSVPAVEISGDSILREEREKEARKMALPLDEHREVCRGETRKFNESLSPQRF